MFENRGLHMVDNDYTQGAAVAEVESLVPGSGARLAAALSRREGSGSGGSGDGGGAGGEQAKPRRRRFGIV